MDLRWSDWAGIEMPSAYSGSAVYETRLIEGANPTPISRFLAPDTHGVLSIGKTTNFESRRRRFIMGWTKGSGHSEANLLFILRELSDPGAAIPLGSIQYRFAMMNSKHEIDLFEELLIKSYFNAYGEVPPLNSVIPDRADQAAWMASSVLKAKGAI